MDEVDQGGARRGTSATRSSPTAANVPWQKVMPSAGEGRSAQARSSAAPLVSTRATPCSTAR